MIKDIKGEWREEGERERKELLLDLSIFFKPK